MKLYLRPNAMSEERLKIAARCAEKLRGRFECFAEAALADVLNVRKGEPEQCDVIVALGGDGTVLRAAKTALDDDLPLLGINAGRLGYLCALNESDLDSLEESVLSRLTVSERTVLEFEWDGVTHRVVNELIIAKGDFGTTLDVTATVGNHPPRMWQGDALLLVTPTGSSAYNRSAGGPYLYPDCGCFGLTPVCPTGAERVPVVFSDAQPVVLSARARMNGQEARLYADGVFVGCLTEEIAVRKSERRLKLLIK